jgi:hypothetical protein
MIEYDIDWLKNKGFFKKIIPLKIKEKEILVDENNLLAYVEVSSNEEIEEIKKELSSQKIRYIWFFFPANGKLKVFRRIGEVKWFYYSTKMRSDYLKSRIDKLSKFSPNNMNILFDIRDIVERFYWQLWEHRILMARSIKELKEDKNKLLVVQRLIDRLIFFYFLAQLKLVKIKNEEKEWVLDRKNTREFFKWICGQLSESDLQEFLNKIFFDILGQVKESGFASKEFKIEKKKFSIVSPCLNGGLFIEEKIEGVPEGKIKISGIKKLILGVLNNYNWIIGKGFPEEEDVIGDLTPEIIGHIYEKFVVSLEQIGLGKIKLKDVQTVREELRYGRKKIGAYYTPEEITNYISMNTIRPYIRDKLKEKFGKDGEILLDNLFKKDDFNKQELNIVKYLYFEILMKIKICDNACGSGSFLIAAGDVLLRLYSKVLKILEDNLSDDKEVREVLKDIKKSPTRNYYIVREIITNNLYGVDIMDGAIEIAKLRFWLWLISQVDSKKLEGKRIETLPNLDFNLMAGNSLIGFVDIEDIKFDFIGKQKTLSAWLGDNKIEWLKNLAKQKQNFKTLPAHEAIKLKEKLNEELDKAREFLNEKFYNMLKSKGIEISKEEFLKLKPLYWGFEFYEVFDLEKPKEERGFDIVIGNPPYGDTLKDYEKRYCENELGICSGIEGSYNIAAVFIGRSLYHMKQNGYLSYIVPNTISRITEFSKLRKFILNNFTICAIAREENPFVGVHLEMDTYILKKQILKNYIVRILNKEHKTINKVSISVFKKYNRFIYMWDDISEFIWSKSQINVLKSRRGPYVDHKETKSGDFVNTYLYNHNSIDKYKINKVVYIKKTKKEKLRNHKVLSSRNMYRIYRCIWNSEKFYPGQGIAIILNYDGSEPDKSIVPILNSKLMDFVCIRYIFNMHNKPSNLQLDVTSFTPIRTNYKKMIFSILCDYMLFLNATEERRSKEKELINFIDKQIIDSLVYELYFKEKFEQDGIKTNLLELIELHLKDISSLNSDEQKLEAIKKVVEEIKNDKKIMEQIRKIKSHSWVRIIEGEER